MASGQKGKRERKFNSPWLRVGGTRIRDNYLRSALEILISRNLFALSAEEEFSGGKEERERERERGKICTLSFFLALKLA